MALGHGRLTPTASPCTTSRRRDTHLEGVIENADANHGGLFVDLRVLRERKRAAERAGSKTRSRRKNPGKEKASRVIPENENENAAVVTRWENARRKRKKDA
jgi:hypothetical protein